MDALLLVLAVIGFLAVLRLALFAAFRLLGRGVEAYLAGEVGKAHARRGDLTSLNAAEQARAAAVRARRSAMAGMLLAAALLIVPPFTPWPRLLYGACVPLWLLSPRRRT